MLLYQISILLTSERDHELVVKDILNLLPNGKHRENYETKGTSTEEKEWSHFHYYVLENISNVNSISL